MMDRRSVLAGMAALSAFPVRAQGIGRIEIFGNKLHWQGAPLRLAGIAMGDPAYIRAGRSLDDYRVVAQEWSANCVRISVHPGHWRYDRRLPDAYLSTIDDAIAFWSQMAERHGADPAVIFELWNEPVGDDQHWVSDGADWPLFKAGWQEITAAIRQTSENIVLCAGGRWAHDLAGAAADPLDDPRTGYSWHVYPNEDRHDPNRWFQSLGNLAAYRPIVVTEWGFCPSCSDGLAGGEDDFAVPFTREILDGLGLGHTAWCYSPGAAPALLAADGQTPSDYGRFVRSFLRGRA